MSVNKRALFQASVAGAIGNPSATFAKKRLVNHDASGLLIVADITVINGNGTIQPTLYVAGSGNANFGAIWQGAVSDSSAPKVAVWEIYPQGIETAGGLRDRVSLALPEEIWIDWAINTQITTFSAEAWWLV